MQYLLLIVGVLIYQPLMAEIILPPIDDIPQSSIDLADATVLKPRIVGVDVKERLSEIEQTGFPRIRGYACDYYKFDAPDVLIGFESFHKKKADDERYERISNFFRTASSGCMGGDANQCGLVKSSAIEWATTPRAGELPNKTFNSNRSLQWTANARLLRPMLYAVSVVHQIDPFTESELKILDSWFLKTFEHSQENNRNMGDTRLPDGIVVSEEAQNHAVMSAATAMALGVWLADDDLFRVGINQWFLTLSTLRDDGSLPLEATRGGFAAYYTGATLTALASISQVAAVQGIDLWGQDGNQDKSFERAAMFFMRVVQKPELIFDYARANNSNTAFGKRFDYKKQIFSHDNIDGKFASGRESPFGWYVLFKNRFPGSELILFAESLDGSESNLAMTAIQAIAEPGMSSSWQGTDASCFYGPAEHWAKKLRKK